MGGEGLLMLYMGFSLRRCENSEHRGLIEKMRIYNIIDYIYLRSRRRADESERSEECAETLFAVVKRYRSPETPITQTPKRDAIQYSNSSKYDVSVAFGRANRSHRGVRMLTPRSLLPSCREVFLSSVWTRTGAPP